MKPTFVRVAVVTAMMLGAVSLGLGVPGILANHDNDDDDDGDGGGNGGGGGSQFVYAAKAICNASVATSINVHNPNASTVTFLKKGIPLEFGQIATAPADDKKRQETLMPDWAFLMGCADISALGGSGATSGWGEVVIESKSELDVWAVYITGGGSEGATALATEVVRVPATKVTTNANKSKTKKKK